MFHWTLGGVHYRIAILYFYRSTGEASFRLIAPCTYWPCQYGWNTLILYWSRRSGRRRYIGENNAHRRQAVAGMHPARAEDVEFVEGR